MPRPQLPFVVTNGDVLTEIRYGDLLDFHIQNMAHATMAIKRHDWQHPFGVVQTRGLEIIGIEEKPIMQTNINAGIYALDPAALNGLDLGEYCDMPVMFERLRTAGSRTIAYPMHEPWIDIGRPEDLLRASIE
jgi:NDP-sugar pyrophosphorylase family protein